MSNSGRFFCVMIPMVFTLASIAFIVLIGLGGTNVQNSYLSNLYFLQVNTTLAAHNASIFAAVPKAHLDNFYAIGLWGYCSASAPNASNSALSLGQSTALTIDNCTAPALHFWFDPSAVWGIDAPFVLPFLGQGLNDTLAWYEKNAANCLSTLYIVAALTKALELLTSLGGLFSRMGSLATAIAALVSTIFILAFAALATATYISLGKAMQEALEFQFGITVALGRTMLIYMWIAVGCSVVSAFFWAFASCCCAGRSFQPSYANPAQPAQAPIYVNVEGPRMTQNMSPQAPSAESKPTSYEPYRRGHGNGYGSK